MRYHVTVPALVFVVTASACGTSGPPEAAPTAAPLAVSVASAALVDRPDVFRAGGTLRGGQSALVSSRVMATVRTVAVTPGDQVRAGQLLVALDDADVASAARAAEAASVAAARGVDRARADVRAAEGAAVLARATHARIAGLAERRSATPQELDEARAALEAAESRLSATAAAVAEAEAGLGRATASGAGAAAVAAWARVVAPFDGVVTEKFIEPGALVAPGSPLVRVEDTRQLEFEVRLDESRAAWATPGASVRVLVDTPSGESPREGRITEVGRAVVIDNRAILVTISLPSASGLRPGMFARADLPGPAARVLVVPEAAVTRHGQLTSVFVVDGDAARLRLVRLGHSDGRDVAVVAGLSAGERVIVSPPPALHDGRGITVRAGAPAAVPVPGAEQ